MHVVVYFFFPPLVGAAFLIFGGGAFSSLPPSLIQLRSSTTCPFSGPSMAPDPSSPPRSMASNFLLNLPTRPSWSSSPRFSVPGAQRGLFVTSRVNRAIDGDGAVV